MSAPRLAGSPGTEGGADAAALPPLKSSAVGLPSFGQMAYLKAGDTQQYMYRLRGKQSAAQLRSVSALGRMEVQYTPLATPLSSAVWRHTPLTTARRSGWEVAD